MSSARVVAVGGATRDVFLSGGGLAASLAGTARHRAYHLPLGEKVEVAHEVLDVGGGAANAAVSFARQGLEAVFLGKVGDDRPGRDVIDLLDAEGVNVGDVALDPRAATNLSTVLLSDVGERTILVFRGATKRLKRADIPEAAIHGDWLYITSLAGNIGMLEWLVSLAHERGLSVALDPGKSELAYASRILALLPKVELLKANREELAMLSGTNNLARSAATLAKLGPTVVGTDGSRGAVAVSAEGSVAVPGPSTADAVDRTGAGDAFGAGLVGALARGQSLEAALRFANRNATACVKRVGATAGLLRVRRA